MNRVDTSPRPNWPARVEEVGLTFHTADGQKYWDESAYYRFSSKEIDLLEKAANDLHQMCLQAAQHIIDLELFNRLAIPSEAIPLIKASWERDDFSLYGRFDLAYDGKGPPKLLEYNADTPTALVEASVAQWFWLQDVSKHSDQFNSIHERLIGAWKTFAPKVPNQIHLGGVKDHLEDAQTVLYIQDTCHQAGLKTRQLGVEDVGFNTMKRRFLDLENEEVTHYFKLYPWEWLWDDEFAQWLKLEVVSFVEPMWKMLLSNKAILPVLWELFEGHPNLLAAYDAEDPRAPSRLKQNFVRKPKLSREGANVALVRDGQAVAEAPGEYGDEGFILQEIAPIPTFAGHHPVLGVWIVNHEACGLGIREDQSLITSNLSRFVPHLF
jgi:glutathionylspermidine synthase